MKNKRVVLRADGNSLIGFGHIYRLLALADILKNHYYLVFACHATSSFIEQEIKKSCNELVILDGELPFKTPDEISTADEIDFDLGDVLAGNEIVVLDGYYFGLKYQQAIKQKNCKLVCIDDLATNYFVADAIINHAPGIDKEIYKTEPQTKVYSGLDYAILREPFFSNLNINANKKNDAFISLGGSDYFEITLKLVLALNSLNILETLHIMCSSSFPKKMMVELEEMSSKNKSIKLYNNLSATQIVNLMDECKHAFVSASTVLLESYARGLICFAGYYTNNQMFIYNGFVKENKAVGLGDFRNINASIIKNASELSQSIQITSLNSSKNLVQLFQHLN